MTESETLDALQDALNEDRGEVKIVSLDGNPATTFEFGPERRISVTREEHELKKALASECSHALVAAAEAVGHEPTTANLENQEQLAEIVEAVLDADSDPHDACITALADYLGVTPTRVKTAIASHS